MKKQTAIEFLIEEIECRGIITKELRIVFEQALEMEKKQIIDFADDYVDNCVIPNENMAIPTIMDVPQYFNETYKK